MTFNLKNISNSINKVNSSDPKIFNLSSNPDDIPLQPNDPRVFNPDMDYSKYDNPDDIPLQPNDPRVFNPNNKENNMSIGDLKKKDYESMNNNNRVYDDLK